MTVEALNWSTARSGKAAVAHSFYCCFDICLAADASRPRLTWAIRARVALAPREPTFSRDQNGPIASHYFAIAAICTLIAPKSDHNHYSFSRRNGDDAATIS